MRMKYMARLALAAALAMIPQALEAACTATGFIRDGINMTAALINPAATVAGAVNATGCNIGVYFDNGSGKVDQAEIYGANYFGVVVNGDANNIAVDITNSRIHDIGETPLNGTQHGVAIYYRAFFLGGSATGTISGNILSNYQKGGIVTNGQGTGVVVTDNTVTGQGPVAYIAQNGIQIGYGANASVMRNTVTGHSYTGTSDASGGIIVVGGAGYGTCPDGNDCPYTVGTRIVGNTVQDNDVGVWLTNLDASYNAPASATNVKVVNNTISDCCLTNGYVYQAGVSDVGNNDKIINNAISGNGYNPNIQPGATFNIDTAPAYSIRVKVHANRLN